MSTILKALRRLEQEKSSQSDRPLGEAVANTPPSPAPRSSRAPWWIAAGSLIGAFAVTALALLVFRGEPSPETEAATIAQAPAASPAPAKTPRAAAADPARRFARAAEPDARPAPPLRPSSAGAANDPAQDEDPSSPDVRVVERPPPRSAVVDDGETEPVRLRRREPRRPGSHPAQPLAPTEAVEPGVEVAAAQTPPKPAVSGPQSTPPAEPKPTAATSAPPEATPSATTAPPQPRVRAPEPVVVAAAPVAPPKREVPAPAPTSEASVLTRSAAEAAESEAPVASSPAGREPTTQAAPAAELRAASKTPAPRPAAAPEAKAPVQTAAAVPRAKPASPPRPAVKPTPPPETPAPAESRQVLKSALPEPSSAGRPGTPDIFVERTIWHPLADRRVAMVSLGDGAEAVELREGESLGPFVVGEIEPTGVFFYQGDQELRRRVGAR
jgi:hypothetical protein